MLTAMVRVLFSRFLITMFCDVLIEYSFAVVLSNIKCYSYQNGGAYMKERRSETFTIRIKPSLLQRLRDMTAHSKLSQGDIVEQAILYVMDHNVLQEKDK